MSRAEVELASRVGVLEGTLSDLLATLAEADKTRCAYTDADVNHPHVIFDERTQTKLDTIRRRYEAAIEPRERDSFEGAIAKYVGPATTGAAGVAAARTERCHEEFVLGHTAECFGRIDLFYISETKSQWLCEEHSRNLTRVPA